MPKGIRRVKLPDIPDDQRYIAHLAASANPGFIYFLVALDLELVKIGASHRFEGLKVAVDKRIQEIKHDVPMIRIDKEYVVLAASLGHHRRNLGGAR